MEWKISNKFDTKRSDMNLYEVVCVPGR